MTPWFFLAGYIFGCLCTAVVFWIWLVRKPKPRLRWLRQVRTIDLGAAARGEVADLAVSAGAFVLSVRDMRRQIDRAHQILKDSAR